VFHQPGRTTGVKDANLLETGILSPRMGLPAKDQGKLSTPTSKSAPCAFMTTYDQQQFKNTDVKG
jgi:hypothetical protein